MTCFSASEGQLHPNKETHLSDYTGRAGIRLSSKGAEMKLGRLLAARPGLVGALFKHTVSRSRVGGRPRVPACPGRRRTDQSFQTVISCFSRVQLFAIPWTVAHLVPLSMGFSRQECWSGFPFRSQGGLPDPGIKPESLISALADMFFITSATWEALSGWGGV